MTTHTHDKPSGWIGVDLDGTLAYYDHWRGPDHVGAPIPLMVDRVRRFRALGIEVRIFTARVCNRNSMDRLRAETAIRAWCLEHIGEVLPITNDKDYDMWLLFDDRCVQIERNTGRRMDGIPDDEATP